MFQPHMHRTLAGLAAVLMLLTLAPEAWAQSNTDVYRFVQTEPGRERLTITAMSITSGEVKTYQVPNRQVDKKEVKEVDPDPRFQIVIRTLKRGDLIQMETRNNSLRGIGRYNPKPGEDLPNHFIYEGMGSQTVGENLSVVTVRVTHFTKSRTFIIPPQRDASGTMVPHPELSATALELKRGDVVEIHATRQGEFEVITSLLKYEAPVEGRFVELVLTDDRTGKLAVRVKDDKNAEHLITVPGRMVGQRFVPERSLATTARGLRPDDHITYQTTIVNGERVLRNLKLDRRATPPPANRASQN